MTEAERIQKRKEYRKEWSRNNRDRIRGYKRNTAIRKVVNAIDSGELVLVTRPVLAAREEAE